MNCRTAALIALCAATACSDARAADFAGGGVGPIPDNVPAGINITFNVSGFATPIGTVRLKLNIDHTWVSDVRATLISPGGVARLIVVARAGIRRTTSLGSNANLAGEYVFEDGGRDLWAIFPSNPTIVPVGRYRASTSGGIFPGAIRTDQGGCATSFEHVFGGLPPANVNGTWTLNIADVVGLETGSVAAATLSVFSQDDAVFDSGFDVPVRGTCQLAWADLTGTGRSSYTLVRNTSGVAGGAMTWTVKTNDSPAGGANTTFVHGVSTDRLLTGDWDGDGIGDAAVWRPGTPGQFIIRPSSKPTRLITQAWGATGDDPTHIGDYDGDGRSDFVVLRGGTAGGTSRTLIKLSGGGPDRDFVTGEAGVFGSGGVDYSGDGNADMAIQANAGAGVASFRLFDGGTGALLQTFNFGAPTSVIVTGNHIGNALYDVTVVNVAGGVINWTSRDTGTGVGQPTVIHGSSTPQAFVLGGDYDGDGIDDYAVWNSSATPGVSGFLIRPSQTPGAPVQVPLGLGGDIPVASSRAH